MYVAAEDLSATSKESDLVRILEVRSDTPNVSFRVDHLVKECLRVVLVHQEFLLTRFNHTMTSKAVEDEGFLFRVSCQVLLDLSDSYQVLFHCWVLQVVGVLRVCEMESLQAVLHVQAVSLAGRQILVETGDFLLVFLIYPHDRIEDGTSDVDGDVVGRIEVVESLGFVFV